MKGFSRWLGQKKEQAAKRWLERQGIEIVAENYACRGGELDLLGWDGSTLICFEVRYRKNSTHGSAMESVTPHKLQRLMHCFQRFVQQHPRYANASLRIDVIAWDGDANTPQWLKNVTG
ncbi:putative endonuclease [Sulfurivirga caldicuralii]|uniref:UPF0102 protein SAMN05443662_1259 n=1 Tax=Sulfurivirga caldicuralii TaxID=364032 RepID=A0A1N6GAE3_9GAMM|nr:YraN family protein [Sulfurivirga caldicuralii]SIO04478.1 putative endonuclease [Sulfurivirga caldicuralii]